MRRLVTGGVGTVGLLLAAACASGGEVAAGAPAGPAPTPTGPGPAGRLGVLRVRLPGSVEDGSRWYSVPLVPRRGEEWPRPVRVRSAGPGDVAALVLLDGEWPPQLGLGDQVALLSALRSGRTRPAAPGAASCVPPFLPYAQEPPPPAEPPLAIHLVDVLAPPTD